MTSVGPLSRWTLPPLRPRQRLRFRMAVGVALGLTVLLAIYAVLMGWAVQLSTQAVYRERLTMAAGYATAVDNLLRLASHQLGALTAQVTWDEANGVPSSGQPRLAQLLHASGTFNALAIRGADGELIWGVGPVADRQAGVAALAGAEAIRQHRLAVSAASTAEAHPPIAVVAEPLVDEQGRAVAALVGTLHLSHAGFLLVPIPDEESRSDRDVRVEIVDQEGRVLASSTGRDVVRVAAGHLELLGWALATGRPAAAVDQAADGSSHVVAFVPFEDLPGGVLVEVVHDLALAVPWELRRIGLFFGAAAVLMVSLGAWWYARHITAPLESLTAATQALAAGDFDRPITHRSDDELRALAEAFDNMRLRLRQAFEERLRWEAELERQVQRRTEDVHRLLGKVMSAQEEERRRIARELHDGAAQDLAALLVLLDHLESACRAQFCPIGTAGTALIGRLHEQASGTLRDLRRLLLDLRPSALDDLGLVPAVRWYVEHRLAPLGIGHSLAVRGEERRLPSTVETALFRIIQEAVHNAARHAAPSRVEVGLDFTPEAVVVRVADDGTGFAGGSEKVGGNGQGFGLAGMRERAVLLGGQFEVQSEPGRGTQVIAIIPLEVNADAHAAHRR